MNNTGSKTDSAMPLPTSNTGYAETTPNNTIVDTPEVDDFGYTNDPSTSESDKTKVDEKDKKVEDDKSKDGEGDKTKNDEKEITKKATGYGDDENKDSGEKDKNKTPEDKEKVPDTDEEKVKKEIEETLKNLPENFDKNKVSEFVSKNKMTKEQVQAYVDFVKSEMQANETAQKQAIEKQRSEWFSELKNDPEFGGENFKLNVDRVEKVLENYFPNTKKVLTERGTMLPPYVMRDYLALWKQLNPATIVVNGEPPKVEEPEKNFLDEMYQ